MSESTEKRLIELANVIRGAQISVSNDGLPLMDDFLTETVTRAVLDYLKKAGYRKVKKYTVIGGEVHSGRRGSCIIKGEGFSLNLRPIQTNGDYITLKFKDEKQIIIKIGTKIAILED